MRLLFRTGQRGGLPKLPRAVRDALQSLDGPQVVLRRPRHSDGRALAATIDDEFLRANAWGPEQVDTTMRAIRSRTARRAQAWSLICERRTGAVIGSISAAGLDAAGTTCELGWWLGPSWRGRGYGTEAVELALAALHRAGITRVLIGTTPDNQAVHRVAAKVGAIPLSSGPHELPDGSVAESVWYAHDAR